MKLIPLTGKYAVGKYAFAIVDDDMYEELRVFKWKAKPNGSGTHTYAVRNAATSDGRTKMLRMHRIILGIEWDGVLDIDHINRNAVDNRRANLRLVSRSVNLLNTTDDIRRSRVENRVNQRKWLCWPYLCRVSFATCKCGNSFRKMVGHQKFCCDKCKQKEKHLKWKASGFVPPSGYKKKSADVVAQV